MPRNSSPSSYKPSSSSKTIIPSKNVFYPTPVNQTPSIGASIKDGIASGFGWGIGTSIAKSIFGGSTDNPIKQIYEKCTNEKNVFVSCIQNNNSEMCLEKENIYKECLSK